MVSQMRETLLYGDSRDPKVAAAGIKVRTGRKFTATEAVSVEAEGASGECGHRPSMSWFLPQDPNLQSLGQRQMPTRSGQSSSRSGGKKSKQDGGRKTERSMDKVGIYRAAKDHLG